MSPAVRNPDDETRLMRAYLLGQLTEDERNALEARFFEDEECYEQLLAVQHDLEDEHARGVLTADQAHEVEERLLAHPEGRRRARLARALVRQGARTARAGVAAPPDAADRRQVGRRAVGWRELWAVAAAVLAVVGLSIAAWLSIDNARLRRELASRAPVPPLTTPADSPPPEAGPAAIPLVAELMLPSRVLRGEPATPALAVPRAAGFIRARLPLDEPGSSFAIAIERAGVGRIWSRNAVDERVDGALIVWLPADVLESGDYEALVWRDRESPSTLVATYAFRIVRN